MLKRVLLPMLAMLMLYMGGGATSAEAVGGRTTDPDATRTARMTSAQYEGQLLAQLNARRTSVGCAPLRQNTYLIRAARLHSSRMAYRGTLSHQLPGEAWFTTRIHRAGYRNTRILAENVGYAWADPAPLHAAWVNSAPHRANMDNCRLRDVGIGVSYGGGKTWATVDFGRR